MKRKRICFKKEDFNDDHYLFEIECQHQILRVHRATLAKQSIFFRVLLSSNYKETLEGRIILNNIQASSLSAVIRYMCTGQLKLSANNVQDHLIVADFILVDEVRAKCIDYILNRLDGSNCCGVLSLAFHLHNSYLLKCATLVCCYYFEKVVEEPEFLELEESCLKRIISRDELNVKNEDTVYQAIIRWISHNPKLREQSFNALCRYVRLSPIGSSHLTLRYSVNLNNSTGKTHSPNLLNEDNESVQASLLYSNDMDKTILKRLKPRTPKLESTCIYVLCNAYRHSFSCKVYCYDPVEETWTTCSSPKGSNTLSKGLAYLSSGTFYGDKLYTIGKFPCQQKGLVKCYDTITGEWLEFTYDLNVPRYMVSSISLDSFLYAIGGNTQSGPTNILERFNFELEKWETCCEMRSKREAAGVAVFNHIIYVFGGVGLKSCECYNPSTNIWRNITDMSVERVKMNCTACKDKIYVVSKRDNRRKHVKTFASYDPTLDEWEDLPDPHKNTVAKLLETDGKLIAIGGDEDDKTFRLFDEFDTIKKQWTIRQSLKFTSLGLATKHLLE